MKKITSLGSLALVLSVSAIALADGPAPAEKHSGPRPIVPPPPFAQLPEGKTTTPPQDKAPKRIPKTEKVDGFFVADPPKQLRNDSGKITNVLVFAKEEAAKDYAAGKGMGFGASDDTVCFSQPSRTFRSSDDPPPTEWTSDIEPSARIQAAMKPPSPPKKGEKPKPYKPEYQEMETTAIHQERFIQEDKKARIEIVDAWVDPVTHGVRQIARASLPLERIGSAWHGIRLYAARSNKQLHVVARRDKPKEANVTDRPSKTIEFRMLSATRQPLTVEMPTGEMDSTQCGFSHVVLRAEPGAAETAMWESNTVFLEPPAKSEAAPADNDAGMKFPFRRRPEEDMPTIRVRPFRATVSSTWSSHDKEPVISVSFGWAGREREM